MDYAARTAALSVRDVTTSQVRFSRAERIKRLQTRQQRQADVIAKKRKEEEAHRQYRGLQSPARQRQAERREQMVVRRTAEVARAEERDAVVQAAIERQNATSHWQADRAEHASPTAWHRRDDMQRSWPRAQAGDGAGSIGRQHLRGNHPLPLRHPGQPSMETETDQKLLRPGRTQQLERKIAFGRPLVPLTSLAGKSQSEEAIAIAQVGPTKRAQWRSHVKQRHQRRKQQQHPRQSASSVTTLPSTTYGKVVPVRDSAWRNSTYDSRAQVSVREELPTRAVWYAQDESRRFVKGNIVKGALPPVQRTGLSLRATV